MSGNEQAVLKLVGRYRVLTRGVLARVVGSEAKADKVLGKLVKSGLLLANRRLPGNRTLYQLSRKGAAKVGLADCRSRVHGTQAMLKHLGVLLYCYGADETFRLESGELKDVVPGDLPTGVYCITKSKARVLVLACYVPSPTSSVESAVRRMRKMHAELTAHPGMRRLVLDGRLGLAAMVDSPQRRRALMDAVRRPDGRRRPLVKGIRIRVFEVPEMGSYYGTMSRNRPGRPEDAGLWDVLGDGEEAR